MTSLHIRQGPTDPDAFSAWEKRQKARYELIDGVVRMMTGGTAAHDRIATNVIAGLMAALDGTGCVVHGSNLKLRSPAGAVMYPDAFVRCGSFVDAATEVDDPVLVVEVFSPRTKRYDMMSKRAAYMAMPSLRHILFIWPETCRVELETRLEDGSWLTTLLQAIDAVVDFEALDVSLGLAQIYRGTAVQPG